MFDRYSGFVRRFCREGPILRNPETGRTSLPRSRTCGRSALSPAAFPVLSPGARYVSGRIIQCPGNSSCFFSLVFRRVAGIVARRGLSSETERCGSFGCRTGPEYRLLSGRSGSRPAPEPPPRRSPAEASYSVRTDTAIIYLIMRRAYPPRSCDISQPRLEAHRPCLRPFPATRSLPTEGSSRAKAGTSGHMIRDGDGVWNKRPFPVQRPSRATSASSLSRYCPYWFLSMGPATSRSFSSDIHPLR